MTDPVTFPAFTFYRPHDRSATWVTGELVDPATGEISTPESKTKQSFVAECDINNIIKSYKVTGMLRHVSGKAEAGAYQDLPDEIDFQASMNVVLHAQAAFASLPSSMRQRFGNDPTEFLTFMSDPANQDEAIKLGLATKRPEQAPEQPQAPNEAPTPPGVPEGS